MATVPTPASPPLAASAAAASGLTFAALQQHITQATAAPGPAPASALAHAHVLAALLQQIEPVDFRQVVGLTTDKEKLKRNHYVVSIAEQVVTVARRRGWGLCRRNGRLYTYNGHYWQEQPANEVKAFLQKAAEKMGLDPYEARFVQFGELLFTQFLSTAYLPAPVRARDAVLINLSNGTFEISAAQQTLRAFAAADFLTYQLPFGYEPASAAPRFQQFLQRVLPDPACQLLLAEYIGYLFVPASRLKLEKTLLLYGSGANGKSVFFEIITALLGEQNVSHFSLQNLTTEPAYSRANLASVLVNYASELGSQLDSNVFKQLVSGEPVEVRRPYEQPYIMKEYGKLLFNCNELPSDVEHTAAFFRRFLILPFEHTIPAHEQDPLLARTIIAQELSGVFNWVLAGLQRLLAQGCFTESVRVQRQLADYQLQADTVRAFLKENGYQSHPEQVIGRQVLLDEYREFCRQEGQHPVSGRKFTERLKQCDIMADRHGGGRCYRLARSGPRG